jgi:tryptophan 2,3-dioxygenase
MEKDSLKLEKLNYNSYLKVFDLLSLQKELSVPPHHDEMFFIVIHQAAELWFKLMLHETEALITAFQENSISRALKVLRRLTAIMDLQVRQINLLSTLTPVEFAGFRDHLMPASGFQSMQFRLIEFAYGIREDFFLKFFEHEPTAMNALKGWMNRPSVSEEFIACMKKNAPQPKNQPTIAAPPAVASGSVPSYDSEKIDEELMGQLREVYENPGENYHWVLLCEGLLDFDEKFALWRNAHGLMVSRTIGRKRGTGGSSGYQFLQSRMEYRFFPELWAIRSRIGTDYK